MSRETQQRRILHFDAGAWRARIGEGFTEANVIRVSDALGRVWTDRSAGSTVLVGYDARAGGAPLAALAGSVMAAYGLNVVVSSGVVSTPAVAWAAAQDPSCVGVVMLAAGQEGAGWGGMLVRGADGGPASESFLSEVEGAVRGGGTMARGTFERVDFVSAYADDLLSHVDVDVIAAAAPLVVADSLHGAVSALLGPLFRRAGARVVTLHDTFDSRFGGLIPRPIEPWIDAAEQLVSTRRAACGICVGGEGVRITLIDERGDVVDPHGVVAMVLGHVASRADMVGERTRVVSTMASSARIRRKATLLGFETTVVPVGFDRLYGEICEGDVLLASEEYGGTCLPAHLAERDGLLESLLVLELLAEGGRETGEHVRALEREVGHMSYGHRDIELEPARIQALRNILPGLNPARVAGKTAVAVSHADGLHLLFDDDSWVMLRPARTEPVVRTYAEAPSLQQREELLQAAKELAFSHL